MTDSTCSWVCASDTLTDYFAGDLSPEDEDRLELHGFSCGTCADAMARMARLAASVRQAVRTDHVLGVVSHALVERLRADAVPMQEADAAGDQVRVVLDRSMRLMIVRLPVSCAGARRVDVRWFNEWDGSVQEELGVCPDRPDEIIIACGTSAFAEASGVLRSRCEVSLAEDPDRRPLATYHLVLDAGDGTHPA